MRLVVVELDQVVFEAGAARADALVAACLALQLPPPAPALLADAATCTAGESAARHVQAIAPDDATLGDLLTLAVERESVARLAVQARVRAGAAALLTACAAEGPVGALTRLPRAVATTAITRAGLQDLWAFVWCADDRHAVAADGSADGAAAPHVAIHAVDRDVAALRRARDTWTPRGVRRWTAIGDRPDRLVAARGLGATIIAVPVAPPEVTPDATWDNFLGRTPGDLDAAP